MKFLPKKMPAILTAAVDAAVAHTIAECGTPKGFVRLCHESPFLWHAGVVGDCSFKNRFVFSRDREKMPCLVR